MRVTFFWKCSRFNVYLKNLQSNWKTSLSFWDNCIWVCCVKVHLLRREYLSSAVNVLANNVKIFHVTKRNLFQLNYLHSDQWIWQSCFRGDWISVSARLPCYFLRRALKRDFQDIYVTTFFGVRNFGNPWAMRVYIFQNVQNLMYIRKMHKLIEKNLSVF